MEEEKMNFFVSNIISWYMNKHIYQIDGQQ